jgi:Sec-independent protein secretion pathway component TatC
MSDDDIEASKAPLMDHLIELRSRLIKALLGFGVAFIFCFFFARQIYNVLYGRSSGSRAPTIRNSSTRRCWNISSPR